MGEQKYRVLAVDDERETLKIIGIMLRNTRYAIIPASNGHEALNIAISQKFELALLDIMLPDISGVIVCGRMRTMPHLRNTPIVMLTALDSYTIRRKAIQAGATDLMVKPVLRHELLAKLDGVMAEHHAKSGGTQNTP